MGTKDSIFMKHKNIPLCPICEYGLYDAINERGFNCNNRKSDHFCRDWGLPFKNITDCDVFQFATGSCRKWVEYEFKKAEAKKQTTLGDF